MAAPKAIKLSEHEREAVNELLAMNPPDFAAQPHVVYEWAGRVRYLLQSIRVKQIAADATP